MSLYNSPRSDDRMVLHDAAKAPKGDTSHQQSEDKSEKFAEIPMDLLTTTDVRGGDAQPPRSMIVENKNPTGKDEDGLCGMVKRQLYRTKSCSRIEKSSRLVEWELKRSVSSHYSNEHSIKTFERSSTQLDHHKEIGGVSRTGDGMIVSMETNSQDNEKNDSSPIIPNTTKPNLRRPIHQEVYSNEHGYGFRIDPAAQMDRTSKRKSQFLNGNCSKKHCENGTFESLDCDDETTNKMALDGFSLRAVSNDTLSSTILQEPSNRDASRTIEPIEAELNCGYAHGYKIGCTLNSGQAPTEPSDAMRCRHGMDMSSANSPCSEYLNEQVKQSMIAPSLAPINADQSFFDSFHKKEEEELESLTTPQLCNLDVSMAPDSTRFESFLKYYTSQNKNGSSQSNEDQGPNTKSYSKVFATHKTSLVKNIAVMGDLDSQFDISPIVSAPTKPNSYWKDTRMTPSHLDEGLDAMDKDISQAVMPLFNIQYGSTEEPIRNEIICGHTQQQMLNVPSKNSSSRWSHLDADKKTPNQLIEDTSGHLQSGWLGDKQGSENGSNQNDNHSRHPVILSQKLGVQRGVGHQMANCHDSIYDFDIDDDVFDQPALADSSADYESAPLLDAEDGKHTNLSSTAHQPCGQNGTPSVEPIETDEKASELKSALEKRAMKAFPGAPLAEAVSMYQRRLETKIARKQEPSFVFDEQRLVMEKFESQFDEGVDAAEESAEDGGDNGGGGGGGREMQEVEDPGLDDSSVAYSPVTPGTFFNWF